MNLPFKINLDKSIYKNHIEEPKTRGTLIEVHIADIHFGSIDSKTEYDILKEQFINKITDIHFDILSVNGDLYDRKFLANQDAILYANKFISDLIMLCKKNDATLLLIEGTESHDAHQLRSLSHYIDMSLCDIRIIETASFQYIKGKTILCLPEEYNKGTKFYSKFLDTIEYDACYMHGTFEGTVYGKHKENLDSKRDPVFSIDSFHNCKGPIIAGHVHTAQNVQKHFYYCGSPIRYKFGEESPKGFYILMHDLDEEMYYIHFEEIKSFRYDTIDLDSLLLADVNEVAKYIDNLKLNGVDNIKIKIKQNLSMIPILKERYVNDKSIVITDNNRQQVVLEANEEVLNKYSNMEFLTDPNIDDYTRFAMYCNFYEGEHFITVDELKRILSEVNL